MASYFITGANRGLGLGFCKALAARDSTNVSKVFAAVRRESDALRQLVESSAGRVEIVIVDITSKDSIQSAAVRIGESLAGKGLDVVINNAGIMPNTPGGIATMSVST